MSQQQASGPSPELFAPSARLPFESTPQTVDGAALAIYLVVFALNAFSNVLPVKIPAAVLVILAGAVGILISLRRARRAAKEKDGDQA